MKLISIFVVSMLFLIYSEAEANSLSGISVTPTRIILSDKKRSAAITLRNTSNSVISYRLNFVEMGFDNNGELMKLPVAQQPNGFNSLRSHVRFSPRQVKLVAGASQVIRVMVQRDPDLVDAEYRSHLEILVLPDVSDNNYFNESIIGAQKKVLPTVVTSLGVTLPVVWRKGELDASGGVDNLVFFTAPSGALRAASLDITRSGERSIFGDLYVYLKAKDGSKQLIASLKDYGVYHPYKKESIVFPARSIHKDDLERADEVWVEFVNDESAVGSKIIFNKRIDWETKNLP